MVIVYSLIAKVTFRNVILNSDFFPIYILYNNIHTYMCIYY